MRQKGAYVDQMLPLQLRPLQACCKGVGGGEAVLESFKRKMGKDIWLVPTILSNSAMATKGLGTTSIIALGLLTCFCPIGAMLKKVVVLLKTQDI